MSILLSIEFWAESGAGARETTVWTARPVDFTGCTIAKRRVLASRGPSPPALR